MKKLCILVLMLVLHGCPMNAWSDVALSTLGNDKVLQVRIGYVKDAIEVGGIAGYIDVEPYPDIYGAYATYTFGEEQITNPIKFGPDKLSARPYIGVDVLFNTREKTKSVGFMGGLRIQEIIVVEYHYPANALEKDGVCDEESFVYFGVKYIF